MKQATLRLTAVPGSTIRVEREDERGRRYTAALIVRGGDSIILDGDYTVSVVDTRKLVTVSVIGHGVYTYEDTFDPGLAQGDRVVVPFGHTERMGVVNQTEVSADTVPEGIEIKPVKSLLVEVPR